MVSFEVFKDDFVMVKKYANLVFRVEKVEETPPLAIGHRPWKPRAYLHFIGGAKWVDWSVFTCWENLEDIVKLTEMEVIAWMAK